MIIGRNFLVKINANIGTLRWVQVLKKKCQK
jgi:Thiamine biosynthesis protein ThiC